MSHKRQAHLGMGSISITVMGHNEATLLPACLESARWADELIYVDCESSDASLEVARGFGARVFSRPNLANLNVNKSHGIDQARMDWVFYLDPDEVISPVLAREIRTVISAAPAQNAFRLPRRNHFFGKWLRHGGQYPDWQLRLFRRGKAHFPCLDVHESLEVKGKTGRLREALDHFTSPSAITSLQKMDFYSSFHGGRMVAQGLTPGALLALRFLLLKPLGKFLRRYLLKGGFLDGWPGLLQAVISSIDFQYRFIKFWQFNQDQTQGTRGSKERTGCGGRKKRHGGRHEQGCF